MDKYANTIFFFNSEPLDIATSCGHDQIVKVWLTKEGKGRQR